MHPPDPHAFFAAWRRAFGPLSADQVPPLAALLDCMAQDAQLTDLREGAYLLATVHHETNRTFRPVEEAYWMRDADAWRRRHLRYYPWHGRGFVQLTWKQNYERAGRALGLDLIADRELAKDPAIAYRIMVRGMREGWFGRPLGDFITATGTDFEGARRAVNGTDKAATIAALAEQYLVVLGCGCFSRP